ncbi:ATP-binding protein [Pseudoalteromonas sp. XMcav11-Q]|uniref:sensor histidine kinase n=1 Tax=Pseudoalteromonas sp. XMcav11-Q TaxID=3136665 RepID=UPI0032C4AA1E
MALISILLITICYFTNVDEKYATKAFVIDIQKISVEVLQEHDPVAFSQSKWNYDIDGHGFYVCFLDDDNLQEYKRKLTYLETLEGVEVYTSDELDVLVAIQTRVIANRSLVIREISTAQEPHLLTEFQKKEEEFHQQEEMLYARFQFTVLIAGISALALILMLLLLWLKRILKPIELASHDWRAGKLQTRIQAQVPEPLFSLAQTMNKMAEDIQQMMEEQQVMSYAMSHELRNPLNGLALAIEVITRKHAFLEDDTAFFQLKRYANELEGLSLNILTLARVSSLQSNERLSICNFSNIIKERTRFFIENNQHIHFDCKISDEIKLKGIPLYFELIVDNLISNAIRYTRTQIKVTLALVDNLISFVVEDDGPGIPEDSIDHILMPFARLDSSRNKSSGGFGLGLAIVNTASNRLGGTVQIENKKCDSGLVVSVIIPSFGSECSGK